jgi:hypothetical protein
MSTFQILIPFNNTLFFTRRTLRFTISSISPLSAILHGLSRPNNSWVPHSCIFWLPHQQLAFVVICSTIFGSCQEICEFNLVLVKNYVNSKCCTSALFSKLFLPSIFKSSYPIADEHCYHIKFWELHETYAGNFVLPVRRDSGLSN